MERRSVSELKEELRALGIRTDHIVEKAELIALLKKTKDKNGMRRRDAARNTDPLPNVWSARADQHGRHRQTQSTTTKVGEGLGVRGYAIAAVLVMWAYSSYTSRNSSASSSFGGNAAQFTEDLVESSARGDVIEVTKHSVLTGALSYSNAVSGVPVVVDIYSQSCGPCRQIAPIYTQMAAQMAGRAIFLKVDSSRNQKSTMSLGASGLPTFVFFLYGKEVARFSGADANRVYATVGKLAINAETNGLTRRDSNDVPTQEALAQYIKEVQSADSTNTADDTAATLLSQYTGRPASLARHLYETYGKSPPRKAGQPTETGKDKATTAPPDQSQTPNHAKEDDLTAQIPHGELDSIPTPVIQAVLAKRFSSDPIPPGQTLYDFNAACQDSGSESEHNTRIRLINGVAQPRLVIVGAGPAGLSAAIYGARAGLRPVILAPGGGGQLLGKGVEVENYPGVGGPGAQFTGPGVVRLMYQQCLQFGVRFVNAQATSLEKGDAETPLILRTDAAGPLDKLRQTVLYPEALIVASGADSVWLGVKGEQELRGQGVSSCATCDGYLYKGKRTAVIGGGDSAMEDALVLARTSESVTVIHRRDSFRASKILAERVLAHPKINILWNTTVSEFISGSNGLEKVVLVEQPSGVTSELLVDATFVAIGHSPNTSWLTNVGDILGLSDTGYIPLSGDGTATRIPGLFAAGDVADHLYRQAITSAGSGAMAALDAERWLSQKEV